MHFLNTTLLLLTSLALIPLFIHLFNRQRVKRVQFSSVRYLKALQKTRMRRLKIRQLILLILRMLIILVLVMAFARPTTEGSYSSALGSAAEASVVILIDNSMSMALEDREGSLFEQARLKAFEILDNLDISDQVALIAFNQTSEVLTDGFTSNHAFVREAVDELEVSQMATEPRTAFEKATELLAESDNYVKEIFLLSDMTGEKWDGLKSSDYPNIENLKIYLTRLEKKDYDNLKVASIDFGNSLIYPGRPVRIASRIVNENPRRVDNLLVSLYINQKRIAQTDLSLEKFAESEVEFSFTFDSAGEHSGFIELVDDDLIEDNRRYFTINIPSQIEVLTLYEQEADDRFLKLAFKPLPDSPTQIELTSEPLSRLPALNLFDYNCVILSRMTRLSQAGYSKLASFVKTGGSLLLFASSDSGQAELNTNLFEPGFGARLIESKQVQPGEGFYRLSSIDYEHPLFVRFKEISPDYLPKIDFYNILQVSQPADGRVLASFSTGSPAIIEGNWGAGKLMAVLTTPDRQDSDLASSPFFVTLVNRAAEYLAYDLTRLRENYLTGQSINRTLLHPAPSQSVSLQTPAGNNITPAYTFSGTELMLNIPSIKSTGISQVYIDDSLAESFAVNFPSRESVGGKIEVDELRRSLDGYELIELSSSQPAGEVIEESRLGKELSKLFFLLALGLIAVEMFLARGVASDEQEQG
jgi:hypothetical protein